ncbi:MAG TPA: hypothetical protein VMQ58_01005 [Candidatus Saccharimonadales bacterium]|jgi:hypothetical protein|nr:hypothetical protein [Candidatus Saccharimonadales bacterium]
MKDTTPKLAEDLNKLAKIPVGRMVEIPQNKTTTIHDALMKLGQDNEAMLQALKAYQAIIDLMMDDIKAKGHIAPHHLSDFRVVRQNALDVIKQAETPKN